jgi:hypothetical protein
MPRARVVRVASYASADEAHRVLAALKRHKIKATAEEVVLRTLVRSPGRPPRCILQRNWAVLVASELAPQAKRLLRAGSSF